MTRNDFAAMTAPRTTIGFPAGGRLVTQILPDGDRVARTEFAFTPQPAPMVAITGTENDDNLEGTAAADSISGLGGNDIIYALGGDDVVNGGLGFDILVGGDGNDQLLGNSGEGEVDCLYGGPGDDSYHVDNIGDLVFENAPEGIDTVTAEIPGGGYYLYANIENLILADVTQFGVGTAFGNTLISGETGQTLLGGGGDDKIFGNGGNDILFGEEGDDTVNGGAGIDYLAGGYGNDTLNGGEGADEIYGEFGNDNLSGGAGFFTDILSGGLGNDYLEGNSGLGDYDLLYGGAGDDIYSVDTAADLVFEDVGGGTDTVFAIIPGGGYYLYDNIENLNLDGTTYFGVGNALDNRIIANSEANLLLGGGGNDYIFAGGGNDIIYGEDGNDEIEGSIGQDYLNGGNGDDTLRGETGADYYVGGSGRDLFIIDRYSGVEYIEDFTPGVDKISLFGFMIVDFSQILQGMTQRGDDTVIKLSYDGEYLVLHNVMASTLTHSDFGL